MRLYPSFAKLFTLTSSLCLALSVVAVKHSWPQQNPSKERWDTIVKAAKEEGQLTLYGNTGYRDIFAPFQKKYPEINVVFVTGRGTSDIIPRLLAEQRAEKFIGDLYLAGPTGLVVLHKANGLDPISTQLVLPEVTDKSKWWRGKHDYMDDEEKHIFAFNGIFRVDVIYNKNLVKPDELKSYWDILDPKWKGKIVAHTRITAPHKFFYYNKELGPNYIRRLFKEMDVTPSDEMRQIADWLAVGRFAIGIFASSGNRHVGKAQEQGLPIGLFLPDHFKEGVGLLTAAGSAGLLKRAPHPNAAQLAINWLLSREGQISYQENYADTGAADSFRVDIPKDKIPPFYRRKEGVKYFDVDRPEYVDAKPVRNFFNEVMAARR